MSRDLVIIEAPGKLRTLYKLFEQIGLHADICATLGHFLENPPDLKNLAIEYRDREFRETERQPNRPDSFACLRDHLGRCKGRILIATDNDQEGHVIALDVVHLVQAMGIRQPVYRMLFSGLDQASVLEALNRLEPIRPEKAVPGTARRITDRLIGGLLSDFENHRSVGRVQSALLGLCEQGIPHSHINVSMPAADGGKPFVGKVPVFGAASAAGLIAELGAFELAPAPVCGSEIGSMCMPMNFGDAVIELNSALDIDLDRAADLLQQMYEAGDITYPRTASRGFSGAGVEAIARLAKIKGIMSFKREMMPRIVTESSPHEAIRILNEGLLQRLDLGKPVKLHATERDAALALIGRRCAASGIPVRRDYPDLSKAPEWARGIAWHRETRRVVLPWRAAEAPTVVSHDPKAAMVDAMMANGIGRPSTWAAHASKFVERDLVDHAFRLTPKGRELLEFAPPALKSVLTSARIEALLDNEDEDASDLVRAALHAVVGEDDEALGQIIERLETLADESDDPQNRYRPTF